MGEPVTLARTLAPRPARRRGTRHALAAFSLLLCVLGLSARVRADEVPAPSAAQLVAACSVRVIHAQREGSTFDPQLETLRPQLTKPPLSAWPSFRLIKQHELTLHGKEPGVFELPGGHEGQLGFQGKVETPNKKRLRLHLEIHDGTAKILSTVFVVNDGGTVLQAGLKHEGGLVVLGVTCRLTP